MATVIAIDSFCDAMDITRHALPAPAAGEPRRRRPPSGETVSRAATLRSIAGFSYGRPVAGANGASAQPGARPG